MPLTINPFALLDGAILALGKEAAKRYIDHTPEHVRTFPSAAAAPPTERKRRKKRSDAGQPRLKQKPPAAPVVKRKYKARVKKAKPRVDPLASVTTLEGAN